MELITRSKISDYLMQLAIVSNPHTKKPKDLFNKLNNELKKLDNKRNIEEDDMLPERDAFNKIRSIFKQ